MNRYATLSFLIPALTAASTAGPTPRSTQDNTAMQMRRANLADVEVEYEERGAGEPVILVHAGVFADWFAPLMEEPALNSRYRLVRYHRVGYAGSQSRDRACQHQRSRSAPPRVHAPPWYRAGTHRGSFLEWKHQPPTRPRVP